MRKFVGIIESTTVAPLLIVYGLKGMMLYTLLIVNGYLF